MPIKILLADKSITIQKVVEMLFSGKEYAVLAVSDGEAAIKEASRVLPDVVLADVDLPRVDGYSLSSRFHQTPQLARLPFILMLSRDDVYDEAKGKQAGITDRIAKPFESQELIGKVKKALSAAPAAAPAAPQPQPTPAAPAAARPAPAVPAPPPPQAAQKAVPSDIFDIIQEAPTYEEVRTSAAPPAEPIEAIIEEGVYEVEPELEMEAPIMQDTGRALPVGERALEEMRKGLGLLEEAPASGLAELEAIGAVPIPEEPVPPQPFLMTEKKAPAVPPRAAAPQAPAAPAAPVISEEMLRSIAEEIITRFAREYFSRLSPPQPPKLSDETLRRGIEEAVGGIIREMAWEVIERVAWEVVPQVAETMIRAEIEKLKSETMPQ